MMSGTIFEASQASSDDFETSQQTSFGDDFSCDDLEIQSAIPKVHPTPNKAVRRCKAP